jgi:hypothetical protein
VPAWLFPSLAALEMVAPFATPFAVVVLARLEIREPFVSVGRDPGEAEEDASAPARPCEFVCVLAWASGPGTVIPILASIVDTTP